MICAARSGSSAARKKKSVPFAFVRSGYSPRSIRWALVMIRLAAAWRKIFVSVITGKAPLLMISRSTFPAPTEGSWSASPTRMTRMVSGTAFNSALMSSTSVMELSSTMSASPSSGVFSLRL